VIRNGASEIKNVQRPVKGNKKSAKRVMTYMNELKIQFMDTHKETSNSNTSHTSSKKNFKPL